VIGPFTITHDANGNQITTLTTGTNSESQYLYDEETQSARGARRLFRAMSTLLSPT
jgi:hypothetical protein